jgi:ABC-type sugar transport system ATPase subunit
VIELAGQRTGLPRNAAEAGRLGIALLPEDRKEQGLVLGMTALENICLPEFAHPPWGTFSRRAATARAVEAAKTVGFDPARLQTPARQLSGGNQQKLLLARWAARPLKVLLADEPTRGVDIGAKAEILNTLRKLAGDGLAMIIASSELEELEALADRVLVVAGGGIAATLTREAGDISAGAILEAAFNVTDAQREMLS